MNPPIRMYLPRGHNLRSKIIETYSHLYNEWRRTHPGSSAYTVRQLNTNIRNAYSVIRRHSLKLFSNFQHMHHGQRMFGMRYTIPIGILLLHL